MKYQDKEWLYEQHAVEGRTQKDIAQECGVKRTTISKWCNRFEITRFQAPYFGTDAKGYRVIQNRFGGELYTVKVHRLVAVAEHGFDAVCGMDVHHKNGRKIDNRPENLEIISHKEHGKISAEKRYS